MARRLLGRALGAGDRGCREVTASGRATGKRAAGSARTDSGCPGHAGRAAALSGGRARDAPRDCGAAGPWMRRRQRRGTAGARPRPGEEAASGATAARGGLGGRGLAAARPSSQPFLLGLSSAPRSFALSYRSRQRLGLLPTRCLRSSGGLEETDRPPWAARP